MHNSLEKQTNESVQRSTTLRLSYLEKDRAALEEAAVDAWLPLQSSGIAWGSNLTIVLFFFPVFYSWMWSVEGSSSPQNLPRFRNTFSHPNENN